MKCLEKETYPRKLGEKTCEKAWVEMKLTISHYYRPDGVHVVRKNVFRLLA